MKRFSKKELFEIRNSIPIKKLIMDLQIPSIQDNNVFRFLCPICKGYNTAVKYDSNLARCFSCCENYNTIEIAMKYRTSDFVDNIKFLKQYLYEYKTLQETTKNNSFNNKCHIESEQKIQYRPKNDIPIHISEIFIQNKTKPDQNDFSDGKFDWSHYCRSNDRRISIIEQKVELLLNEFDALHKKVNK